MRWGQEDDLKLSAGQPVVAVIKETTFPPTGPTCQNMNCVQLSDIRFLLPGNAGRHVRLTMCINCAMNVSRVLDRAISERLDQ